MNQNNNEWLKKINYWASLDEEILVAYRGKIKLFKYIKKNYIDEKKSFDELKKITLSDLAIKVNSHTSQIFSSIKKMGFHSWNEMKFLIIKYRENKKEE